MKGPDKCHTHKSLTGSRRSFPHTSFACTPYNAHTRIHPPFQTFHLSPSPTIYDLSATLFSAPYISPHPINTIFPSIPKNIPLTLLCHQKPIALLNRNAMARVLVVGGEPRRMRTLCDFAVEHFPQSVDALGWVGGVGDHHEMHAGEG
jgi:hypothetical protein